MIIGSPAYMAPEQARGDNRSVGPGTDVWALGAILYECLTGRPPFTGANTLEVLRGILHDEPAAPARALQSGSRGTWASFAWSVCTRRCRAATPAPPTWPTTWPASARSRPIRARPAGVGERAWALVPGAIRCPAGLLGLVALVLVAGTTVSTLFGVDATEQARIARRKADEAETERKKRRSWRATLAWPWKTSRKRRPRW